MNNFIYTLMGVIVISPIVFYTGYHQGKMSQQNDYYVEYNKIQEENVQLRIKQKLFNSQLETAINNQKVVHDIKYKIIKQQVNLIKTSNKDITVESSISFINGGLR